MERRLGIGERGVEVQCLRVHRQRGEQHVVGLGDGAAGPVQVAHAQFELLEPQTALFDDLVRAHATPNSRAISINCTSVVPSPISRILLSR